MAMTPDLHAQAKYCASDGMVRDSHSPLDAALTGLAIYYFTSLVVIFGAFWGMDFVRLCTDHPDSTGIVAETIAGHFAPWDGVWYRRIATEGYSYDPERMSNVAFFPFYPIVAGGIAAATGIHIDNALLLTSHIFLLGAFLLMAFYIQRRSLAISLNEQGYILLVLGVFPTTFYCRMSYTESAFLFMACWPCMEWLAIGRC